MSAQIPNEYRRYGANAGYHAAREETVARKQLEEDRAQTKELHTLSVREKLLTIEQKQRDAKRDAEFGDRVAEAKTEQEEEAVETSNINQRIAESTEARNLEVHQMGAVKRQLEEDRAAAAIPHVQSVEREKELTRNNNINQLVQQGTDEEFMQVHKLLSMASTSQEAFNRIGEQYGELLTTFGITEYDPEAIQGRMGEIETARGRMYEAKAARETERASQEFKLKMELYKAELVREFEYYESLTPSQQERWKKMYEEKKAGGAKPEAHFPTKAKAIYNMASNDIMMRLAEIDPEIGAKLEDPNSPLQFQVRGLANHISMAAMREDEDVRPGRYKEILDESMELWTVAQGEQPTLFGIAHGEAKDEAKWIGRQDFTQPTPEEKGPTPRTGKPSVNFQE